MTFRILRLSESAPACLGHPADGPPVSQGYNCLGSMRTHPGFNPERSGGAASTASRAASAASAEKGGVFMHRDLGVQRRRLDVKRNEKADRDPGGQDRGQGHLHRGFAVLPVDFLAQVLDVNPHPTHLDLLSETTAYRSPAIDRAPNQGR